MYRPVTLHAVTAQLVLLTVYKVREESPNKIYNIRFNLTLIKVRFPLFQPSRAQPFGLFEKVQFLHSYTCHSVWGI